MTSVLSPSTDVLLSLSSLNNEPFSAVISILYSTVLAAKRSKVNNRLLTPPTNSI